MTKERKSNCEIVTAFFIQLMSFFTWNVLHKFSSSSCPEICFIKGWKFYTDFILLLLLFHFENKFVKKRREWSCSKCNFNFFSSPKSRCQGLFFFAKKSQNSINLWLQNVSQKFDQKWGGTFQNFLRRKFFFFWPPISTKSFDFGSADWTRCHRYKTFFFLSSPK